jgi:ribonucleotide reductase beta subunit family protein with ferritin-like domain
LAVQLGVDAVYGAMNPFPFMERISLSNKTNFFEHTRQSEYSKARIGDDKKANEFALDADF